MQKNKTSLWKSTASKTIVLFGALVAVSQALYADPPSGYVIEWGWYNSTAQPAKMILSNATAVAVGRLQCLALKADGTVVAWGRDVHGYATFDNTFVTSGHSYDAVKHLEIPGQKRVLTNGAVAFGGKPLSDIAAVAAGDEINLGLTRGGAVIGWGANSMPSGPSNVIAITASGRYCTALKNDGTVVGWGGQSNIIAIAAGGGVYDTRLLALKRDGTVISLGQHTTFNEHNPPSGLSNVVAVAAGNAFYLALKSDGTVVGWGQNDVGQATGVPTEQYPNIAAGAVMLEGKVLSNVVSISAHDENSMALKKDGTIVAWGRMVNSQYPATVPEGLSGVVFIANGSDHCLAITTNRAVAEKFQQR